MKIKKILEVVSDFYSCSSSNSYCSTDEQNIDHSPKKILNSFKEFKDNTVSSIRINCIEATIVFDDEYETEQTELFNTIEEYEYWYYQWFDKNGKPLDREYHSEKRLHKVIKVETEFFTKAFKSVITLTEYDSNCSPDNLNEKEKDYRTNLTVYSGTVYATITFTNGFQDSLTFDSIDEYREWYNKWFDVYGFAYNKEYTD